MAMIGRLKPGVTVPRRASGVQGAGKQIESQHPERNDSSPALMPLDRARERTMRPALIVLACAVGVVMLIVCANLSNLLLARMGARQKEMAIRTALGAGRWRLVRQMLTESVALSCCGAALGLLLAVAGTRALAHLRRVQHSSSAQRSDGWDRAGLHAAGGGCSPAYSLACCRRCRSRRSRCRRAEGYQPRVQRQAERHAWIRSALVVSEIAFACVLLVGAGLLMRSFLRVLDVNLGFQPEQAAALRVDPEYPVRRARAAERIFRRSAAARASRSRIGAAA